MIWRIFGSVIVVILGALGAFLAWSWHSEIAPQNASASSFDVAAVRNGAQLASIGNCNTCHTEKDRAPYAGGFPVATPFGTIYGTNITPDPDTGIGTWSEAAFKRAMREGLDRKGNHLYPAFPYDHFTHATDRDLSAVYAFLMTREPVAQDNRPPEIPFPLNLRIFAAAWKLLFLRPGPIKSDPSQSTEWNRGAYLAEGLAHCASCHTPRNALGAEKRNRGYGGGQIEGWRAPALTGESPAPVPWTTDQIYAYLRDGFAEQHGAAAGPMASVVASLQQASDSDVRAIATYFASLSGGGNDAGREAKAKEAQSFAQSREPNVTDPIATTGSSATGESPNGAPAANGAIIFAGACASCHHSGGELPISRPVGLAFSTAVNATDPTNFIRITLEGIHPSAEERGMFMPGFSGALTDQQIVALAAYVRGQFSRQPAWQNIAATVSGIRRDKNQQR
jgi:mono/diheme cytochrome c family protein